MVTPMARSLSAIVLKYISSVFVMLSAEVADAIAAKCPRSFA